MSEIAVIEKETNDVITQANALVVTSNEQETKAVDFLKIVKNMQNEVNDTFGPIVEKAHAAHKEVTTQRNKFLNPLLEAEKRIKKMVGDFRLEMERKRQEQERKIREEAEKKAEAERQRLAKQAEKAAAKGNEAKASELQAKSEAVQAPTVIVEKQTVKQGGMGVRSVWKARIVNGVLVPREYCCPNIDLISNIAKSTKGTLKIAGVEFYEESVVSMRV